MELPPKIQNSEPSGGYGLILSEITCFRIFHLISWSQFEKVGLYCMRAPISVYKLIIRLIFLILSNVKSFFFCM